jgi:hypothetical protein
MNDEDMDNLLFFMGQLQDDEFDFESWLTKNLDEYPDYTQWAIDIVSEMVFLSAADIEVEQTDEYKMCRSELAKIGIFY